jgi:hypothetical protein
MNRKLSIILEAVTSVELGLLRFRNEAGQQNIRVKIAATNGELIHCTLAGDNDSDVKTGNKRIHLIQKNQNDYFFISGRLTGEMGNNQRILSIAVIKASWFEKKRRGNTTWLREKFTYESDEVKMETFS